LVEEVSASLTARTGASRAGVMGTEAVALFVPQDRAAVADALARLRAERAAITVEAALLTPQGDFALDLGIAPRLDDRGRLTGFVLAGRPVGEIKQAYVDLSRSHDELKAAQALLVRNEKLASLGRLLAGVAHELNNPISFVYANAHALDRYATKFETYFDRVQAGASREELIRLREDLRLDREIRNLRTAVQGARDGAERVRDIVEDLRRLSADGSGEMRDFDLVETARVAASWVLRGGRRDVALRFEGAEHLMARGREGHVQQVVMNLVQNALDALDGVADPQIVLTAHRAGAFAELTVSDNGPGVPTDLEGTIFDPFFTTKPVGRGTGLGLSISHKIAEEHGGALRLVSRAGEGAAFRLELPRGAGGGGPE
jgi:two-component system sensor histidine kinase HupT/HoxJ